jgi:putative adenylate-forming enzyme
MSSVSLSQKWTILRSFVRARWGYRFRSRAALCAWQNRKIARYLREAVPEVGYYGDRNCRVLAELPIIDKATMLARFPDFNAWGMTAESALQLALQAEAGATSPSGRARGMTFGLSSGTSGRPGVFIVGARERAVWAGTILARVLDSRSLSQLLNPFASRLRVGLVLRANSNLYATVNSARVDFQFLEVAMPVGELMSALESRAPHVLVAPASVLRVLAEARLAGRLGIQPRQIISVAEVLEPDDAVVIERAWHRMPSQVYQCTEGFLGYTCEAGNLHLNEEFVHVEPQWLDDGRERFVPILTDFTRTTQIFARYRLDDVLRVDPDPCPCGRVTLRLAAIEGRCDDVLWLRDCGSGRLQPVFPDLLRRVIARARLEIVDYRIDQVGERWELRIRTLQEKGDAVEPLVHVLRETCRRQQWHPPELEPRPWSEAGAGAKRRRIRCVSRPYEGVACAS